MTGAEPSTETEELSGSVLASISAYAMGAALDARDLYRKTASEAAPSVVAPANGCISDDVYHVADYE